jgi:integrase
VLAKDHVHVGDTATTYTGRIKSLVDGGLEPAPGKVVQSLPCETWSQAVTISIVRRKFVTKPATISGLLSALNAHLRKEGESALTKEQMKVLKDTHKGHNNSLRVGSLNTKKKKTATPAVQKERLIGAIHRERFDALLQYFRKQKWTQEIKWITVIFGCALRPNEAESLTFGQFRTKAGQAFVVVEKKQRDELSKRLHGEGERETRVIEMDTYLYVINELNFTGALGKVLPDFQRNRLNQCIQAAAAVLDGWRPEDFYYETYSLRHGRAVTVRNEHGLEKVQLYTGHATENMARHYSAFDEERIAKAKNTHHAKGLSAAAATATKKK